MTVKDLDTRFKEAVEKASKMTQASLPQDVQLRLYAFFKQATIGTMEIRQTSSFHLRDAFKTNAWMQISHLSAEEAKEQLGTALLPLLERFAKFATEQLAPALQGLVDGLTRSGRQGLTRAFYDAGTGAVTFGYDMDNVQGQAYLLGEQLRKTTEIISFFMNKSFWRGMLDYLHFLQKRNPE